MASKIASNLMPTFLQGFLFAAPVVVVSTIGSHVVLGKDIRDVKKENSDAHLELKKDMQQFRTELYQKLEQSDSDLKKHIDGIKTDITLIKNENNEIHNRQNLMAAQEMVLMSKMCEKCTGV